MSNDSRTRGADDRAQVLAGMELMRWAYGAREWDRLVDRFAATTTRRQKRFFGTSTTIGAATAGGLALTFGAGLWGIAVAAALALPAAVAGGALVAYVLAASEKRAVTDMRRLNSPEVVFTSHGVIIGDAALLWRGDAYWLVNVWLYQAGPLILELIFNSREAPLERIKLPIPFDLEYDVAEMAKLLEAKVPHQRNGDGGSIRRGPGPGPKVC